jgi:hypothetical protein
MSDHRSIPTHREVSALCAAVRDSRLDDEQRERLAQLLDTIGSAVRVAPTVADRYPGQPERAAAAALGCWDGVPGAYAALLQVTSRSESAAAPKCGCPRACRAQTEGPGLPEEETHVTIATRWGTDH